MKVGDAIVIAEDGSLSARSNDGRADEELQDQGTDSRVLGVVVDVRDPEDDSLIKTSSPAPNVESPMLTLGTLRAMFENGQYTPTLDSDDPRD